MKEPRPLHGILWMIVSGLCFTAVNVLVKHVGQSVPAPQAVFVRYLAGLVFLVPLLPDLRRAGFSPPLVRRFMLRGAIHAVGAGLWFAAMAMIPMGEVTAMGYLQPVYITVLAVLFLGERIAARRIAAIGAAILGALIVLRPGFRELSPGHVAMLFSAPCFAASYVLAKRLTDETSAGATLAWMNLTVTVFLIPGAWLVWEPLSAVAAGWLFVTAVFATGGHYAMLRAFAAAPITVTQPVTFLQLVWSVTLGALLFAEPADGWVILGGAVILGSVVFIAWREAVLRRRALAPVAASAVP